MTQTSKRGFRRLLLAGLVIALSLASCGGKESGPDLDIINVGLTVKTDIQAGNSLEFGFLSGVDGTLEVTDSPPGVDARIEAGPEPRFHTLFVKVDENTPRGDYALVITLTRGDRMDEMEWKFEVVD